MMQNHFYTLLVVWLVSSNALPQQNTELEDLITQVFDANNNNNNDNTESADDNTKPIQNTESNNLCETGYDCVPIGLCVNNQIVTDGTGVIDLRINDDTCSYLHTCCAIGDHQNSNTIDNPIPLQIVSALPTECGFRNIDGIIGRKVSNNPDNVTEYGEFPWMVAILVEMQMDDMTLSPVYQCGGSIISHSIVLTAAHCVSGKELRSLSIRAGEWDTQTTDEPYPNQIRSIADVAIHNHFNRANLHNDIALLFLQEPLVWERNVQPICLPPTHLSFDYSNCYVAGWGKNIFGKDGMYQVILKKIELPIVPEYECEKVLRTTRLSKYFKLDNSFMCAGGIAGQDVCTGDGGSPLVCPIANTNHQYYQAGIVAWGIGCGGAIPGVYTHIPHLRSWIDSTLENRKMDNHKMDFTPNDPTFVLFNPNI